jgi:uncharacterized repeat protein (TIGR04076 family)
MTDDRTMKRREFLSTCGLAGAAVAGAAAPGDAQRPPAAPVSAAATQPQPAPPGRRYRFEVEVVECKRGKCAQHELGQKFAWPADRGRMCSWLLDSMSGAMRVLEYGGTMSWLYEGTPYKKVIDPEGITTEFIRCPDPTDSGVVAKITRTRV